MIQVSSQSNFQTIVSSGLMEGHSSHPTPSPSLIPSLPVIINKGPLSYNYTLDHLILHYGSDNKRGSEHLIDGFTFPAELQMFFYNSQLYPNWSDASHKPHGVVVMAILIQLTNFEHPHENHMVKMAADVLKNSASKDTRSRSKQILINFSILDLLPTKTSLKAFITYEGSLTQPSCSENVDWIILNKPLYISGHNLNQMRNTITGFGDNFRPVQPILRRCIRTNIDYGQNGIEVSH